MSSPSNPSQPAAGRREGLLKVVPFREDLGANKKQEEK